MSTQLLFYKEAVPVSKEQHAAFSIDTTQDYSFASGVNSVPLTAIEFPFAARDYVNVFAYRYLQSMNNFSVMVEQAGAGSSRSN